MTNLLITGGTDGIGRAVALDALAKGHRVVCVGSSQAKGEAFLRAVTRAGWAERARFLRADLRLVSENERVLAEVKQQFDRLDRLILCAQRYETRVGHTSEGVERNFALSYLSRHLLAYGLVDELRRAREPLVVNVCGTGTPVGRIHFDDLQYVSRRGGLGALLQAARASDLLGVAFSRSAKTTGIRFVLYNPDVVRTNLQRELSQPWRTLAMVALALRGKPVEEGVRPLLRLLDDPPHERLTAYRGEHRIDMTSRTYARCYDPVTADRLQAATADLLAALARTDSAPG